MASTELNRSSGIPLYRQIRDILREEISSGVVSANEPLTEAKLIARFKVSLAPIRQALQELTQEGFIYRQQGRGTFPVEGISVDRPADLKPGNLYNYLRARGLHPESSVSGIERIFAPASIALKLNIEGDEEVLHFTRLISADGAALSENDIYIRSPREFLPTPDELNGSGSALALLEQRFGVELKRAEHEAWATSATPEIASLLGVKAGSPVLVIDTVFYSQDGTPVGWRSAVHRPEDFKFHFVTNS